MSLTAAATVLPWSEELEKQFTFNSRYDGPVKVFRTSYNMVDDSAYIVVPRGAVPVEDDFREDGLGVQFTSQFKPQKPEQGEVIAKSVGLLHEDKQFIIAAPTGWGKTYVGVEIAAQMGRRFCVITTKEDILQQWVKAIQTTLGLTETEIGIWRGDSTPNLKHLAVVALVQSVCKGHARYPAECYKGFGMLICDEVHRMAAEQFSETMWLFAAKYRIGLSATPYRKDGKDKVFLWHIGPVMVEATMEVMIPKVLMHKTGWKVPRTKQGKQIPHDYGNISVIMKPLCRSAVRNDLICKYLKSTADAGRSTIAFSDNLEQLQIINKLLLDIGVTGDQIGFYVGVPNDCYGDIPKKLQFEVREQHKARQILLATYKMASEATDIPWLDTCLMMSPRVDVTQIVGRIRREYEDKKFPVVIDLVDDDSHVLASYAKSRRNWYKSLGCEVKTYGNT